MTTAIATERRDEQASQGGEVMAINFCRSLGAAHIPERPGMWGPATVTPRFEGVDGMDLHYYGIWIKCARCGEDFNVARFISARAIEVQYCKRCGVRRGHADSVECTAHSVVFKTHMWGYEIHKPT